LENQNPDLERPKSKGNTLVVALETDAGGQKPLMQDVDELIRQARILIVDDGPANVVLLEEIFFNAGYVNVWSTQDPRNVNALYLKWQFDLILLDIHMPHMDGIQVMEQLSKSVTDSYLPILVLTAQTDTETRMKALQSGAKDFLTKPFQHAEVLLRIRNMLEVRQYYNMRLRHAEILEAEVHQRTEEINHTRLEIIHHLGRASEYRDNETGMHVIRMSKFCEALARAMGHDENACEIILHATPMHDVGKIGIPDCILLKPDKLNPDEWETMKTHVDIGGKILSQHDSPLMAKAHVIAMTHHEKWDGSGYPCGFVGEEIPIEGRITAICDVFDALTSVRPYKAAWSIDDTVAFLEDQREAHFDPELVAHFIEILPTILEIRDQHADSEDDVARLRILQERHAQSA